MPKKRNKENIGLPGRWRFTRNAYYYQVPPGSEHLWDGKKTFKLGKTLPDAYKVWSEKIEFAKEVKTISELLERYSKEVIPAKAVRTQRDNARYVNILYCDRKTTWLALWM